MREPLTEEERAFLTQVSSAGTSTAVSDPGRMDKAPAWDNEAELTERAGIRLSPEQHRALWVFHQTVASQFGETLSESAQQTVHVRLSQVNDETYSQFTHSRPQPTCFVVLNARPLPHPLALDISPSIFFPLLDCLLGGGRHPFVVPNRPLTAIEVGVAKRLTSSLLNELHDAWEHVLAVDLSVDRIESYAPRARIIAAAEPVVSIQFEVELDSAKGQITLCIPLRSLERVIEKAPEEPARGSSRRFDTPVTESQIEVHAATLCLTLAQIEALQEGEVIVTDTPVDQLMTLMIDGEPRFRVQPGEIDGRKAVVIKGRI